MITGDNLPVIMAFSIPDNPSTRDRTMTTITIKVETQEQADKVVTSLRNAEEQGELTFDFSTHTERELDTMKVLKFENQHDMWEHFLASRAKIGL